MEVRLDDRWEPLMTRLVSEGRYGSEQEIVEAGLKALEANEAKLAWLRNAIREGEESGDLTPEEYDRDMEEFFQRLDEELKDGVADETR